MAALFGTSALAWSQPGTDPGPALSERAVADWLARVHAAPRQYSFVGTIVVSSHAGAMSSARIWHAWTTSDRQVERVEALSGPPRSSLREGDKVVTLLPEQKLVRVERHESLGRFPDLLTSGASAITGFYSARPAGTDRVAGFETDVVLLAPRDALRFGYRVWTERKTGLPVKVQTLAPDGPVLEQTAFSELKLGVPLQADKLVKMMAAPKGWRVEHHEAVKTTAAAEGWNMKPAVAGFKPIDCYRRGAGPGAMQCVFSDGLASVSLFVEPDTRDARVQPGMLSAGATHTLSQRLDEDWWVTAVGEVPPQTLRSFVQSLERRP